MPGFSQMGHISICSSAIVWWWYFPPIFLVCAIALSFFPSKYNPGILHTSSLICSLLLLFLSITFVQITVIIYNAKILQHRWGNCSSRPMQNTTSITRSSSGDLAPSLGGTEIFFADQDFWMTFFQIKFPFSRPKFLMTFFSYWPGFSDFLFLLSDFPYLLLCSMSYVTLSSQEQPLFQNSFMTPFFTLFVLRAHPATLLLKILGGRMRGPSPEILGGPSPSVSASDSVLAMLAILSQLIQSFTRTCFIGFWLIQVRWIKFFLKDSSMLSLQIALLSIAGAMIGIQLYKESFLWIVVS